MLGKTWRNFDLEELVRAPAEVLGKGTFGTTYKVEVEKGLAVVVKKLRDVTVGEKQFTAKMKSIARMDHPNIVPLRAYCYNSDDKFIVYDFLPMGSLSAILHGCTSRSALDWKTRAAIALGAARGISYIHAQGSSTSHGNIKSSNILLTESYEARVSDASLAQIGGSAIHNHGYVALEVVDPRNVSQKSDVYSFGILLLELVTGEAPMLEEEEGVDLSRRVLSVLKQDWSSKVLDIELFGNEDEEVEDMVKLLQLGLDCTDPHPDNRPSMPEVTASIQRLCPHNVV